MDAKQIAHTYKTATGREKLDSAEIGFCVTMAAVCDNLQKQIDVLKKGFSNLTEVVDEIDQRTQ